jgi:maleate isomerase
VGRIYIQTKISTDEDAQTTLRQLREGMEKAVRDVCTCKPDHLVMGMSSETFVGGLEGSRAMGKRMEEMSELGVSMGSDATREVLEMLGVRRIAVLTPYQPSIDAEVDRYFKELGYDMVAMKSLRCPTATSIADVTGGEILDAIAELEREATDDFDVFIQAGTNLSSWRVARPRPLAAGRRQRLQRRGEGSDSAGRLRWPYRRRSRPRSSRCSRPTQSVMATCCSCRAVSRWTPRAR